MKARPGIKVPALYEALSMQTEGVTLSKIRNEIRRNLPKYIEMRGSKKSGGYYLKRNVNARSGNE